MMLVCPGVKLRRLPRPLSLGVRRLGRGYMENDGDLLGSDAWRTPTAISVAAVIGIPVGVLLDASAVPFGPVLLGWLVALAGALIVPGALCILATHRYVLVGFAYAAGAAGATVVAGLVASRGDTDFWGPALQFAIVFVIVGLVSLIATGPCALLKWEDRRARAQEKPSE
jgi:hypothetical protein